MSNRIHTLFQEKKEKILSIYFTAGYPSVIDTLTIIQHLDKAGVDMIEIGFPFSDPLADGPVIQQSSQQAIDNGMSLPILFQQLKSLRTVTQMPVLLMGYLNPVLQFGEEAFIAKCYDLGIDGIIIPDMPLSYYQSAWKECCRLNNVSNIMLITPETTEGRIREIDENSDGFIYMVSSNSITGGNKTLNLHTAYFDRIERMGLSNPTVTGFGIYDKTSFRNACRHSRGAIIGSAFIKHIADFGVNEEAISEFVKKIKE